MNSPFSRLLPEWRLSVATVLVAMLCVCTLATTSLFCGSAYADSEQSFIPPEDATPQVDADVSTDANQAQSSEDMTSSNILDVINEDEQPNVTPPKDSENVLSGNGEEATSPTEEPEPIEKGLVFHAAETSPHLTAYFDGVETAQSGWVHYKGHWYWFDKSPYAVEKSWIQTGNSWYYLDETGKLSTGTFSDGEKIYLSDTSGRMLSNGWVHTDGSWYYLSPSGAAHTGWLKLGSTWYWLDPTTGVMGTGWYKDGSTWYFSDSSGAMLANRWLKLGSTWYYLNPSGAMRTGWLKLGSTWYWLDKTSGAMGTGWYKDGSTWYYSNGSGAMLSNQWLKLGSTWYYLNSSGAMRTGWLSYHGSWYWLDRSSGAMATGWVDDNGTSYYCDGSGRMLANRWIGNTKGGWHYAEANGAMAAEWKLLSSMWYYFDPADPQHKAKTGLFSVGANQCYADADGALFMNRWVDIGNGERSYANNQGYLNGRQTKSSSGAYMFVDGSGVPLSGWQVIGGTYFLSLIHI